MRWLALATLAACGGTFDHGEATLELGRNPYGGLYNPDLHGCTVSERSSLSGITAEYDGRGRRTSWLYDDDWGGPHTIETGWDGPCRVHEYEVMQNAEAWTEDRVCDEHGWPVSSHRAFSNVLMEPHEPIDTTWTNTYDGDLLVKTEVSTGFTFEYAWTDGRLAEETVRQQGDPIVLTYAYADGWITEIVEDGGRTTTYTYDDERLVSVDDGYTRSEWTYTDGDWPSMRVDRPTDGEERSYELHFDCP